MMESVDQLRSEHSNAARIEEVNLRELSAEVLYWIDEYERVAGDRDRYLWKWLATLFPGFRLSCVPPSETARLEDVKLLASIFVTLLDDIAERHSDRATFEEAAKIPFDHQTVNADRRGANASTLTYLQALWTAFEEALGEAPRREEFQEGFHFDLKQTFNAIEYSYLINQNVDLCNLDELEIHGAPNMMLFTYVNVDLMHSPVFEMSELGTLRTVVLRAQEMARIGNWITTWEREVREGDYSSAVVMYALQNDIVSATELYELRRSRREAAPEDLIERIRSSEVEELFFHQWQEKYVEIRELGSEIDSVDVESFLRGMQRVIRFQFLSKGLK